MGLSAAISRGFFGLLALRRSPGRLLVILALLGLIGFGATFASYHLWALYHWRAAKHELERYHIVEARQHLDKCLAAWPRSTETHLLAAQAARQAEDLDAADHHLDQFLRFGGNKTDDRIVLERILLRAQRGDIDTVLPFCQQLVTDWHPSWGLVLEALALSFKRVYRTQELDLCLDTWLQRDPDNLRALTILAWSIELHGLPAEAAEKYQRVVELDPENEGARLRLASALLSARQPDKALPHLEKLRQEHPDNPTVLVALAQCWRDMGRVEEAEALVDAVLAKYPRYSLALLIKGDIALQSGRPAEAVEPLREAVELAPGDTQARYQLARALSGAGRDSEAREADAKAASLQADLLRLREIVTKDLGRANESLTLRYELGVLFLRTGSPEEGVYWLKRVLDKDPNNRDAHKALAEFYQKSGNLPRAAYHRQMAKEGPAPGKPDPGKPEAAPKPQPQKK